jgi:6-phosphofructokinase
MKIGILTSGGDCPGLNAVIRAITRKSFDIGYEVVGIQNGWKGIFEESYMSLDLKKVAGIVNRGGTIPALIPFRKKMERKHFNIKLHGLNLTHSFVSAAKARCILHNRHLNLE